MTTDKLALVPISTIDLDAENTEKLYAALKDGERAYQNKFFYEALGKPLFDLYDSLYGAQTYWYENPLYGDEMPMLCVCCGFVYGTDAMDDSCARLWLGYDA
jgi:hypothetical protein